jgi:glycosyltransferase involved in cell wall biosynthesis
MKISIVIVHHRKVLLLLQLLDYLIESLTENLFEFIEIIVVDNYSSDSENLKTVSNNYTFPLGVEERVPVQFLFLEQNHGPSYARNRGVEKACGEYIQFLDEDDWIEPIKLLLQYDFAVSHGYPSFVASKWARVSFESTWNSWTLASEHCPDFSQPTILSLIKNDGFVPLMAGIVNRNSFVKMRGFKEEMWLVEDVRCLIDIYQSHPHFVFCPADRPMFFYRIGQPNSLSAGSKRAFFCNACYENVIHVEQLLKNDNLLDSDNSSVLSNIYGNLARFFFEHNRSQFNEILIRLYQINPKYLPIEPKSLRFLSKLLGYEKAESISLTYRRIKSLVRDLYRAECN